MVPAVLTVVLMVALMVVQAVLMVVRAALMVDQVVHMDQVDLEDQGDPVDLTVREDLVDPEVQVVQVSKNYKNLVYFVFNLILILLHSIKSYCIFLFYTRLIDNFFSYAF